jgi:hypothetical protein
VNFFKRNLTVEINKTYDVILHHDSGAQIQVDRISDITLKFIRDNLGRDRILTTDSIYVNLRRFSIAEVKNINQNRDVQVKR